MYFSNLCIPGKVKMENTKNKNENNGSQNVGANLQSGNYGNFLKKFSLVSTQGYVEIYVGYVLLQIQAL